jgi:hypothetical protein
MNSSMQISAAQSNSSKMNNSMAAQSTKAKKQRKMQDHHNIFPAAIHDE